MEDRKIEYIIILMDIPWWYYAAAVIISLGIWKIWKKPELAVLAGYAFLILAATVMIRQPYIGQHFQPELFWSWKMWDTQLVQILANVVIFVPFGYLAGRIWKWRGLLAAAGFSVLVEILQLITARGFCEFDDVIHNMIGAVIGIGIMIALDYAIGLRKDE